MITKEKKCILFKGGSCFPQSPCEDYFKAAKKTNIIAANDQLLKIFKMCDTEGSDIQSFITTPESSKYFKSVKEATKYKGLRKLFSGIDEEIVAAIESLLQINPYFRPSAEELTKNSIFDAIRVELA